MNLLRVLIFAACFKQLAKRYPSMFDGEQALAEINQAFEAESGDGRVRVVAGEIVMTTQMLEQVQASEDAFRRHQERCERDPAYYQRWVESVDWDLVESGYDDR